jgi:uncharacterized protein (DUF885 family)
VTDAPTAAELADALVDADCHDVVLSGGELPSSVLADVVTEWTKGKEDTT